MNKTRYAKVNDRLETIVDQIRQCDVDADTEFDHIEWLMCEQAALVFERENIERVMTPNGFVKYGDEDN